MDSVIAENVSFIYKDTTSKVLNNISLSIPAGTFALLCGATGSGKTSLIRSMNGLIPHFYHGKFYGYMKIKGIDTIENTSPGKLSQHIGSVFQLPENQLFSMNVERELAFSLENMGFSHDEIEVRINRSIQILDIEHLRFRPPYELSGGEQQKVAIAALLTLDPDILVLDEPLSNMDPSSAEDMVKLLQSLREDYNKTIIISEHRLEYVLGAVNDLILISNGKIIDRGVPQEVLSRDEIFTSGVDLPPTFREIKQYRAKNGTKSTFFPVSFEDQVSIMGQILQNMNLSFKDGVRGSNILKTGSSSSTNHPILRLEHVSYNYDVQEENNSALQDVCMNVYSGEIIGILGENGAGKSTLLKCLNGIIRPQMGKVWYKGKDTSAMAVHDIAQEIGVMFQNPDHQLFATSVADEIRFSLKSLKLSKHEQEIQINTILTDMGLEDLRNESPFSVSGGQKKKISLASILCRKTPIIVFDEPTIGQDATQKELLSKIIFDSKHSGMTVIIVTHDMNFIAGLADRLFLLHRGKILTAGSVADIFNDKHVLNLTQLLSPLFHRIIRKLVEDGILSREYIQFCTLYQLRRLT